MYIASQVFATIGLLSNLLSKVFKKQSQSLFVNIFSCVFGLISCLFLYAYMGVAGLVVSTTRSIVFYFFAKNNWEKKLWLVILFVGLQFALCVITACFDGFIWYDFLLIFLKGSLFTYGAWQHNMKFFRILSIISCIAAAIYYLIHLGYINAFSELLSIVILIVVMIKETIERKKLSVAQTTSNAETLN